MSRVAFIIEHIFRGRCTVHWYWISCFKTCFDEAILSRAELGIGAEISTGGVEGRHNTGVGTVQGYLAHKKQPPPLGPP